MSQYTEGPVSGIAGEALAQHRRVKFTGSSYFYADVEADDGTIPEAALAIGDQIAVVTPRTPGSRIMVASGAITAGANVYPAADGKVTATVQGRRVGKALTTTTADGDFVEVLRTEKDTNDLENTGVNALTGASMQITAAMCKNGVVTTSHSGAAAVLLPAGKVGMRVTIIKIDANAAAHTITPDGSEKIQAGSTFTAVDAQYDTVTLEYVNAAIGWNITGKHIA